jgi:adenylylsulfate kinase-like enzyme
LTVTSKAIAKALDIHLDRLKAELVALDGGKVRHAVRHNGGQWIDKTEEAIHDKRNLLATFEAIRRFVSTI